jgi:hypothetical protein
MGVVAPPAPEVTSDRASAAPITVAPLDGPNPDIIGISPASRVGLPRDLWGSSTTADVVRAIRAERVDTIPEMKALLQTLLTVEAAPPADSNGSGQLLLARVDRLLDFGALDQALVMLSQVDSQTPETFRRLFDASLLLREEGRACTELAENPQISPSFKARIFCLARTGDWSTAALSLRTGVALGFIAEDEVPLIERFLDPDLAESEEELPLPERPSPLILRMMEAIGQPIPTTNLPVAFAHGDLSPVTGWKARLEAAERLARAGALPANTLLALYTERPPAASGGIWDRVAAIQALDIAVTENNAGAVAAALPEAWRQMELAELEADLATLFGATVAGLGLEGEAGDIALRLGLLSPDYEKVAIGRTPANDIDAFLLGLAKGEVTGLAAPNQMGAAIRDAFSDTTALDEEFTWLLKERRLGEALLRAIDHVTEGARGDLRDVTAGLRLFREVGLESVARRASLQLLLLERRG